MKLVIGRYGSRFTGRTDAIGRASCAELMTGVSGKSPKEKVRVLEGWDGFIAQETLPVYSPHTTPSCLCLNPGSITVTVFPPLSFSPGLAAAAGCCFASGTETPPWGKT